MKIAVKTGNKEAIQHLIVHGADTNSEEKTVFEICPRESDDFLIVIMQSRQALLSTINGDLSELHIYSHLLFL